MHTTRVARSVTVALAATLLLAAGAGHAAANRFSFNYPGIRLRFPNLEFSGGGLEIRCPVTLEGRLNAAIFNKVNGSVVGRITNARVAEAACTESTRVVAFNGVENYNGGRPESLPWNITYEGFSVTLPNITKIRLLLSGFRFGATHFFCTAQYGTATDNLTIELSRLTVGGENGLITAAIFLPGFNTATLFRRDGGILCPATVRAGTNVAGVAAVEAMEAIYVTLAN